MKMNDQHFLAFDLGAESGRAILGTLKDSERIELKEIHRFSTGNLRIGKHYFWNIYRFYEEIIIALLKCVKSENVIPQSVGVDTWGVDFGLIGKDGSLLRIPYSYRDPMTETSMTAFLERMSRYDIYQKTGIALHKFNSLYQLFAMKQNQDPVLQMAEKLLFMPDLINYLLSGEAKSEFTFATTSQLYNPQTKSWDQSIFDALEIPIEIMQEVVKPGTVIGQLNENICRTIDVDGIKVMAVTSHDTASGIASVPSEGDDWAYISSGTWSLMGMENKETIVDHRSLMFNFTNEGGVDETYRFLKNIMGLWILQQCRASWNKKQEVLEYPELVKMAEKAAPFEGVIDPDYPGFYNPLDMPAAIETYCRQTGQVTPKTIGSMARTILESLALKYRMVMDQLQLVTGRTINVIHIIGGGSKNELLCQFTANATGKRIVAGPSEATGLGNILLQAKGLNHVEDLTHLRRIVRNSFDLKEYLPKNTENWEIAYEKFQEIAKQN